MANGEYVVVWRAVDGDGHVGQMAAGKWFDVRLLGFQFGMIATDGPFLPFAWHRLEKLPDGSVLGVAPRDGRGNPIPAAGTGDTSRVAGAAYAVPPDALEYVEVAIAASGAWLQPDGTFAAPQAYHLADCRACFNSATAYWFFDAELADGTYTAHVRSGASSGVIDDATWAFQVNSSIAAAPQLTIDQADGIAFSGGQATFSGEATDDMGVLRVRYSILDRDTRLWLADSPVPFFQADRTHLRATLSDPNSPSTGWEIALDLPPGRYRLVLEAWDQVLHLGSLDDWHSFTVSE